MNGARLPFAAWDSHPAEVKPRFVSEQITSTICDAALEMSSVVAGFVAVFTTVTSVLTTA